MLSILHCFSFTNRKNTPSSFQEEHNDIDTGLFIPDHTRCRDEKLWIDTIISLSDFASFLYVLH